jgi:hypothetical protein
MISDDELAKFRASLDEVRAPAIFSESVSTGETYIVHVKTVHGISAADIQACDWCSKLPADCTLMTMILAARYRVN